MSGALPKPYMAPLRKAAVLFDATDFGVPVLVFLNLIPKIYQDFKPLNISHYLADARAHQLPLVGGLDPEYFHDWTEILNRWGLLNQDTAFAFLVRLGAVALMLWT